ncbi:hypothetical protein SAMN00768000_0397 [Sulfobacillus thermosulfidooxidans DSM 9293]|uniref:Uncharacterized protein n=1 Tax=Sulfobacillus thermosulfidooxidans (strain DSM 9293 / VKM B-1269 / AT-1) TaxID=929705 RepID=A0A1W1W7S2_SULTA|nr:hypothetical protein SAMN00768000_0397 [Sulfobacillus thermosulfidooxidans DSM 9293]
MGEYENNYPGIESAVHPRSAEYPECGGCRPPAWVIGSSRAQSGTDRHQTRDTRRGACLKESLTASHHLDIGS